MSSTFKLVFRPVPDRRRPDIVLLETREHGMLWWKEWRIHAWNGGEAGIVWCNDRTGEQVQSPDFNSFLERTYKRLNYRRIREREVKS